MASIENYAIDKNKVREDVLNYRLLRQYGLDYISKLSGKIWTDYNVHDPGITILELLCYALTDLGYRASFDIKDILTFPNAQHPEMEDRFIPAEKILSSLPITLDDYREWFIKKNPYLRNIWFKPIEKSLNVPIECFGKIRHGNILPYKSVKLKGFYRIIADMNEDEFVRQKSELDGNGRKEFLKGHIRSQFMSIRNLCEEIEDVVILDKINVGICVDIEIKPDIAYEPVIREVSRKIGAYINNERTDNVKKEQLNVSDAVNLIMDIPGVVNIHHIHFVPEKEEKDNLIETQTRFNLTLAGDSKDRYAFRFDHSLNEFVVTRGLLSLKVSSLSESIYKENDNENTSQGVNRHLPVGKNRELDQYISIQDEFPRVYQLGREKIAASASNLRKAQRLQLKAYLIFFDQLLADYLAQLNSVKDLLSWSEDISHTYFFKGLSDLEIADFGKLVSSYEKDISGKKVSYSEIIDPENIRTDRRNRFLNHLIARFNEEFVDYSILNFVYDGKIDRDFDTEEMIRDKIAFLKNYAHISGNRSHATDYTQKNITSSVLESRIYSKLGLDIDRVGQQLTPVSEEAQKFAESYNAHFGIHLYEHILFRPLDGEINRDNFIRLAEEIDQKRVVEEPYSMRITVVAPGWLKMAEKYDFRKFVEQTVRMEVPAHIAVKICWLDLHQMNALEKAYGEFMKVLAERNYVEYNEAWRDEYGGCLASLVKIFSSLRSIYPPLQLYSPGIATDYAPPILDHSMLSGSSGNNGVI